MYHSMMYRIFDIYHNIYIYITKASFAELELPRLLNEVKYYYYRGSSCLVSQNPASGGV